MAIAIRSGEEAFQVQMVCLDELVPQSDVLRRVERLVDWEFVRETARPFYSELGRPGVDPVVLVKVFLVAAIRGVGSMRETLRVAEVDLAIRRFLGYGLTERLPHHATFSYERPVARCSACGGGYAAFPGGCGRERPKIRRTRRPGDPATRQPVSTGPGSLGPSAEDDTFSAMTTITTRPHASLAAALDAFCSRPDLAPLSARTYRLALERLAAELDGAGERWPTEPELEAAALSLWGGLAPASFNRNLAAARSFLKWSRRHGFLEAPLELQLDRRREPADRTRAIPYPQLERLWSRERVALREKTLWRLLYETAGRAGEILALDIEDLDLANKRARIRSKGGDLE